MIVINEMSSRDSRLLCNLFRAMDNRQDCQKVLIWG